MFNFGRVVPWVFKSWQMSLVMVGAFCVLGLGIYWKGRMDEERNWIHRLANHTAERIENRHHIELKIMRKPDHDIQKELEEKWCPSCLQSVSL